ncbi:MAG: 1-acyl-sn-glycerol-3-phosphate acyltransferase [candidate division Zixibacteria bacterium]|nr:1-acyl-sn-glycerol-3-phosphate acyltransferase [candidate division Zixibacteria bacterium]
MKIVNNNKIPRSGSFILASNHISLVDPPFLGSAVGRPMHFIAKRELFTNRLFGTILRRVNAIPVNRRGFDKKAIENAMSVLTSDSGMVIFPEGTRSLTDDFLKPHPGVGLLARNADVPIVPAYIHGTNKLRACFWGKEKMAVVFGDPIDAGQVETFSRDKDGYRALAETVMERIRALKDDFIAGRA